MSNIKTNMYVIEFVSLGYDGIIEELDRKYYVADIETMTMQHEFNKVIKFFSHGMALHTVDNIYKKVNSVNTTRLVNGGRHIDIKLQVVRIKY